MHTTLNISLSSLVQNYRSMGHDYPRINNWLSYYDEWLSSVLEATVHDVKMLPLNILMTLPALVAASASSIALAMSGIGAVLSFAFGIVDIVSSVLQEKNVRDQLQRNKNILYNARVKLDRAFTDMKTFQTKFCKFVIKYFEEISKIGRQYESVFDSLYIFISKIYGHTSNRCSNPTILAKFNLINLTNLQQNFLQPIEKKLTDNVESLNIKILEVKETKAFLDEINKKVTQQHQHPVAIFRFIKSNKPTITNKMFGNLFELLEFISKSVLPTHKCYWGQNLDQIRSGLTTDRTYTSVPVCSTNVVMS